MLPINVVFDDSSIAELIIDHINGKTADLINLHTALKEPSAFLPYGFSDSESEEIIKKLKEAIHTQKIIELNDYRLQFALSCILEALRIPPESGGTGSCSVPTKEDFCRSNGT